jgi:hypothetical protein
MMPRRLAVAAISLATLLLVPSSSAGGQALEPRLHPLSPLVGVWDTEDHYETPTGPGVERGQRTCAPALKGRYLACVTTAPRRSGGEREYRFYFSWDERQSTITLLQLWSDVSGFSVTTVAQSKDGRSFDLRGAPQVTADGLERRSWGTLTIESPDLLVWSGRANVSSETPDQWRPVFREVSRRRQ